MKVVIIGAGAVGGSIGIPLQQAGHDVTFIARGEHLRVMKEKGLKLLKNEEEIIATGTFIEEFTVLSEAEFVIITAKGTETQAIVEQMKPLVSETAKIISFQNGVSNEEIYINTFGKEKVIPGVANLSAKITEPGTITQNGSHLFIVGELIEENRETAKVFVALCKEAGLNMKHSTTIMQQKWEKCLWNLTFNPVSALAKASVGEMLDDEKLRMTCERILEEAVLISEKSGFPMSEKAVGRVFKSAELIRHHKTSMLQDLESEKKMEVYSLCGYFVDPAKELGVEAPVLETVYYLLQFINKRV